MYVLVVSTIPWLQEGRHQNSLIDKIRNVLLEIDTLHIEDIPIDVTYIGYRTNGKLVTASVEDLAKFDISANISPDDSETQFNVTFQQPKFIYRLDTRVRGPKIDSPIRASTVTFGDHLHAVGKVILKNDKPTTISFTTSATKPFKTKFQWDADTPEVFRDPMQQLANSIWFYNLKLHQNVDKALKNAIKTKITAHMVYE